MDHNISHTDVNDFVPLFPPCMSHVQRLLRTNHRLRHHSRIQYTLFLKEVGLPVHEALMFWRQEYSHLPSNKKSCSHDWSRDEARYSYNIRHLYGLEGSRINYRGHSCQSLQENFHSSNEEGGCPFSRFDRKHLHQLLMTEGYHGNCSNIFDLVDKGNYSLACSFFLSDKIKGLHEDISGGRMKCNAHKLMFHEDSARQGLHSDGCIQDHEMCIKENGIGDTSAGSMSRGHSDVDIRCAGSVSHNPVDTGLGCAGFVVPHGQNFAESMVLCKHSNIDIGCENLHINCDTFNGSSYTRQCLHQRHCSVGGGIVDFKGDKCETFIAPVDFFYLCRKNITIKQQVYECS